MIDTLQTIRDGIRTQLREQHLAMRDAVRGLDAAALNWQPGADTNSIAQMLGHALEAERFLVATAMGIAMQRDRETPFHAAVEAADDLNGMIDHTERELESVLNHLTLDQLSAEVSRTISTGTTTRSGFRWLLLAVSHSREHIGQALLTRQLYEQRAE